MDRLARELHAVGQTYDEFRKRATKHQRRWDGVYEHLELPDDAVVRLKSLPGRRHVLVLAEDWCGDAASLIPILAKMADAVPELVELRVLRRDEHLELMDDHLSHGGRSIPVAIVFDEEWRKLGWWGPRPGPAQALFREKILALNEGRLTDRKEEVNEPVLEWYRQDRGRHTIDEFLNVLERGGELRR